MPPRIASPCHGISVCTHMHTHMHPDSGAHDDTRTCHAEPSPAGELGQAGLWLTPGALTLGQGQGWETRRVCPRATGNLQGLPGRLGILQGSPNPGESTQRNSLKKCEGRPPLRLCSSAVPSLLPAGEVPGGAGSILSGAAFPEEGQPTPPQAAPAPRGEPSPQPSTHQQPPKLRQGRRGPGWGWQPPSQPEFPLPLTGAFAPCPSPFPQLWPFPAPLRLSPSRGTAPSIPAPFPTYLPSSSKSWYSSVKRLQVMVAIPRGWKCSLPSTEFGTSSSPLAPSLSVCSRGSLLAEVNKGICLIDKPGDNDEGNFSSQPHKPSSASPSPWRPPLPETPCFCCRGNCFPNPPPARPWGPGPC